MRVCVRLDDFKIVENRARASNIITLDVFLFVDTFYSTTLMLAPIF
jgi:hypothetical protein